MRRTSEAAGSASAEISSSAASLAGRTAVATATGVSGPGSVRPEKKQPDEHDHGQHGHRPARENTQPSLRHPFARWPGRIVTRRIRDDDRDGLGFGAADFGRWSFVGNVNHDRRRDGRLGIARLHGWRFLDHRDRLGDRCLGRHFGFGGCRGCGFVAGSDGRLFGARLRHLGGACQSGACHAPYPGISVFGSVLGGLLRPFESEANGANRWATWAARLAIAAPDPWPAFHPRGRPTPPVAGG